MRHRLTTLAIGVLAAPFLLAWKAYVLAVLWAWFVVPRFGVPELTVPQAFGLWLVLRFAMLRTIPRDPERKLWHDYLDAVGDPAIALAVGWIVRGFL